MLGLGAPPGGELDAGSLAVLFWAGSPEDRGESGCEEYKRDAAQRQRDVYGTALADADHSGAGASVRRRAAAFIRMFVV